MSTGKIEVWINGVITLVPTPGPVPFTVKVTPCRVDQREWYVSVWDCCREPLDWCGTGNCFKTICGHVDIEVPPGCYYLRAALYNPQVPPCTPREKPIEVTGIGIATVGCGQEVCVILVPLIIHRFLAEEQAIEQLIREAEKMKPDQGQ